jgi:hypothetical protein
MMKNECDCGSVNTNFKTDTVIAFASFYAFIAILRSAHAVVSS